MAAVRRSHLGPALVTGCRAKHTMGAHVLQRYGLDGNLEAGTRHPTSPPDVFGFLTRRLFFGGRGFRALWGAAGAFYGWAAGGPLPQKGKCTGAALKGFGLGRAPGSPAASRPPNRQTDWAGTSSDHGSVQRIAWGWHCQHHTVVRTGHSQAGCYTLNLAPPGNGRTPTVAARDQKSRRKRCAPDSV
jgi:hypothetical protein